MEPITTRLRSVVKPRSRGASRWAYVTLILCAFCQCALPGLLQVLHSGWRLRRPTGQVLLRQFAQGRDPLRVVVQAGDVVELFAATREEGLSTFHGYFFQRFQAVAGEAGTDHVHSVHTRFS